jgi:NADP-dependent 3-hydroxy acid dehydrogenase YdfG
VVTGASSGIGHALAAALARTGDRVWAVGRSRDRLEALAEQAADWAGAVLPVVADLERDDDLASATRQILSLSEDVDVLVHSAGVIAVGTFESVSAADFDRQYRVNLRAPVVLTQTLLPALKRAGGQVVFVNSSAGLKASSTNALYAATKHGLKAVADGLRDEVNPDGVRVISVFTGRTATPLQEALHEQEGWAYRPEFLLRPEDVAEVVLAALAVPPSGEITDVNVRPMAKLPPP